MSDAKSESATAMRSALQNRTVRDVLYSLKKVDGVIEVDSNAKPVDAAKLLWEHNLLSLPVWDATEHKYIGYFDMRDILSSLIASQKNGITATGAAGMEDNVATKTMVQTSYLQERMNGDNDKEVSLKHISLGNPVYCCTPNDSLDKLCELLSKPDCRRILVCKEEQGTQCFNIISQATLVKYLAMHTPLEKLNQTLDEAGLEFRKDVVAVEDTASALQAFELIASRGLSGIAVVDEDKTLVGNTSARDIKLVALQEEHTAMELDILSYLAAVRQEDSPVGGKKAKYQACHVRETSTVKHVLCLLAKTGYHRVFVTDSYLQLVGVISGMDILHFIVEKGSAQLPHDLSQIIE